QFGLEAVAWAIVVATCCFFSLMTFQACRIVKIGFWAMLSTQRYGVTMALGCTLLITLIEFLGRLFDAESWVVLLMNGAGFGLALMVLLLLRSKFFLGPQGTDMANQIYSVIRSRINKKTD